MARAEKKRENIKQEGKKRCAKQKKKQKNNKQKQQGKLTVERGGAGSGHQSLDFGKLWVVGLRLQKGGMKKRKKKQEKKKSAFPTSLVTNIP